MGIRKQRQRPVHEQPTIDEEVEGHDHGQDRLQTDLADLARDVEGIARRRDQARDPGLDLAGDVGDGDRPAADHQDITPDEGAQRQRQRVRTRSGQDRELAGHLLADRDDEDADDDRRHGVSEADHGDPRPSEPSLTGRDQWTEGVRDDRRDDERGEHPPRDPQGADRRNEQDSERGAIAGGDRKRGRSDVRQRNGVRFDRAIGGVIGRPATACPVDEPSQDLHGPESTVLDTPRRRGRAVSSDPGSVVASS